MSKEELLKLIDSINIEEIDSITINYYIEKEQTSFYGHSNERKLKKIICLTATESLGDTNE